VRGWVHCSHMVRRLRAEGYWVRGVDLKYPDFGPSEAHDFVVADLRLRESWSATLDEGWTKCTSSQPIWVERDTFSPGARRPGDA